MYRAKRIDPVTLLVTIIVVGATIAIHVAYAGILLLVCLLCWVLVRLGKLFTYRTKTIRVDFGEFISTSAPTVVAWKRRFWGRKQTKVQIQLGYTWFSHPQTEHFAEAQKFILSRLENAKRIEVDYVPAHKTRSGLLIGEVYVDDVLLNLECIKRGYAEACPSVSGKEVKYIYRKANKKAAKKKLGIHSVPSYAMR